jgi:hypothetical protein
MRLEQDGAVVDDRICLISERNETERRLSIIANFLSVPVGFANFLSLPAARLCTLLILAPKCLAKRAFTLNVIAPKVLLSRVLRVRSKLRKRSTI